MGHAKDGSGQQAGITEDDLVGTVGGRIAAEGCPDVCTQGLGELRQGLDKGQGQTVAAFLAVGAGEIGTSAVMADGHGDLFGQGFVEFGCLLADVVFQVGGVYLCAGKISGKEKLSDLVDDIDNGPVGGNRHRADVVETVFGLPGGDQFCDDFRDSVVQADAVVLILTAGIRGGRGGLLALCCCHGDSR